MSRGRVAAVALALLCSSGTASAHQVGGTRFDAPIPLSLLFGGAAATVAVTAVLLAVSGVRPGIGSESSGAPAVRVPSVVGDAVATAARVGFLLAVVAAVIVGFVGPRAPAENVATLFVWAVWLKGVGFLAALVGDPWPTLSPWRTAYDALARVEGEAIAVLGEYPERLGEWPAFAGLVLGIGVVENLTVLPRSPSGTALLVLGYATAMLAGGVAFGPEWFRRADALAVLYRLFGRVAPLRVERTGGEEVRSGAAYEITVRPPWRGAAVPVASTGAAFVVVAAVYAVSFDAFTSTREYRTALFSLRDAAGLGPEASVILYLGGLTAFLAAFAAVGTAADRIGGVAAASGRVARESRDRIGDGGNRRGATLAFAPTLLLIAVAYEVGHNYPYVLRNVGQLVGVVGGYVASAPPEVAALSWLTVQGFWWSQVALIVVVHVLAVVAGHVATADRYPSARAATLAHAPLALLMIGYTVASLWTISRPVVV